MAKIKVPDGRGFDIVVWQKNRVSPAYACPYTFKGRSYLRKFLPRADFCRANDLKGTYPQDLLDRCPSSVSIGGISPGARIPMRLNPRLH